MLRCKESCLCPETQTSSWESRPVTWGKHVESYGDSIARPQKQLFFLSQLDCCIMITLFSIEYFGAEMEHSAHLFRWIGGASFPLPFLSPEREARIDSCFVLPSIFIGKRWKNRFDAVSPTEFDPPSERDHKTGAKFICSYEFVVNQNSIQVILPPCVGFRIKYKKLGT